MVIEEECIPQKKCFGNYTWKVVPRLKNRGISEIPMHTEVDHTPSSCALKCQIIFTCKQFRYNQVTKECDLYNGEGYKAVTNEAGNQFYQRMPPNCVAGRDEWFSEYRSCIWINTDVLPYEDAKLKCESEGRTMMGAKSTTQIRNLMHLLDLKWIHAYARRTGSNSYEWLDGTRVTEGWCPSQPDSYTDCVGVDLSMASWCSTGGLDDINCTHSRQFFCY
ncbi:uncharacterized protein LOC133191572 [Saccostrea echinata]|uniref:uncharacterized protein LOC133191572 n=1 Tax=Saccostrea echinata TaxID=191078 RepID=UPI002A81BC2B|nr:uncharacterized protein LOC133191572 [Saccostrea echinata]